MAEATRARRTGRIWRTVIHIALIALVLALAAAAFLYWGSGDRSPAPGASAPPPGDPLDVAVVVVRQEPIPLAPTYLGRTRASQAVEIRARVSGFLEQRAFEEGARVEAGQLLYRIDSKPFDAALLVAQARVQTARARLEQAERQVARLRQAATSGAISSADIDQAETEQRVAIAELRLAEAQAYQAQLDVGYTSIESPIAGIIGQSQRDVGSYLSVGNESPLAVVQQTDPMYVEFSVSEREILNWQELIAAGRVRLPSTQQIPLTLELSDGSEYRHPGHINFVGVQVDPTTGTALARGAFPNPEGLLRPGQFVRVTSRGIERLDAVLVPQKAVLESPGGANVYVVDAEGRVEVRPVVLGEWRGDAWVINEGLQTGDRVVVDRLMQLRPGAPVRAQEVPAPDPGPPPTAPPDAPSGTPAPSPDPVP